MIGVFFTKHNCANKILWKKFELFPVHTLQAAAVFWIIVKLYDFMDEKKKRKKKNLSQK